MKEYLHFDEIEKEVKEDAPGIVYKYRTWDNTHHKKIITENKVWFSHPFDLNDPYDIRPPYNFRPDHIKWDEVKAKMRYAGRQQEQHLTDAELEVEVEKKYLEFKDDPVAYFGRNREDMLQDRKRYDPWGVFSCCTNATNDAMWAHYGDNHQGFAIGFDTVALARALYCTMGKVDYTDQPLDYFIMGNNEGLMEKELFRKATKWSYEDEFRFVTVGVDVIRERVCSFPPQAVKEIVFGMKASDKVIKEVRAIAEQRFPGVQFYQVVRNASSYGLKKVRL
jgi:hypothetical protein